MRLTKDAIGKRLNILLEGMPTAEVIVKSITEEEIIGEYTDGEEIHCSHEHLRAWWIAKKSPEKKKISTEQLQKMQEGRRKNR